MADETSSDALSTDQLMEELRRDDSNFDARALADILLDDAIERHELGGNRFMHPQEMELQAYLRIESHRPIIGKPLVFLKRTVIMPLFRWLLEYSIDNFRRQQTINDFQSSCLRALVLENARLRRDLEKLTPGDD